MSYTYWKCVAKNELVALIFLIAQITVLVGFIVYCVVHRIRLHLKRRKCIHDDECTRSTDCCEDCEKIEKEF